MSTDVLLRRALETARHLSDPEPPWEALLRNTSALLGTDGAILIVQRHGHVDVREVGADAAAVRDYVQHFHAEDLLLAPGLAAPVGSPLDTQSCLTTRQRERSSYYHDFMCRHRMRQLGTVVLSRRSHQEWSSLGFQREVADAGLAERMASPAVSRYLGELNRAIRAREEQLAQWRIGGDILLEALGEAAVLVSPQGAVIHAGTAGRTKLDGHRLLRAGMLWHPTASVRALVHAALARADSEGQSLSLRLPADAGSSVELHIAKANPALGFLNESLILVRARFPLDADADEMQLLRMAFRITLAEAKVLRALVRGRVVKEYARDEGLSVHTVRKQVAHLMEKMDCSRQLELVRKAMRVLGG